MKTSYGDPYGNETERFTGTFGMTEDQSQDYISSESKPSEQKSEIHRRVQQYIGKRYEIHLTDGRFIRGTMVATDKDSNMVFNRADERWTEKTTTGIRFLGQAMIAKKHVVSMKIIPDLVMPQMIRVTPQKPEESEGSETVDETETEEDEDEEEQEVEKTKDEKAKETEI